MSKFFLRACSAVITSYRMNSTVNPRWELMTMILLERRPCVSAPMLDVERQYHDLTAEMAQERSLYSDHELKAKEEARRQNVKKSAEDSVQARVETTRDLEEKWSSAFNAFKVPAPQSEVNSVVPGKDVSQMLDERLVFLIKTKKGAQSVWCLPATSHSSGETMRQCAERALTHVFPTLKKQDDWHMMGNAPWGFYKYKYPKPVQEEKKAIGAKAFLFKVQLSNRNMNLPTPANSDDYCWIPHAELKSYLPKRLLHEIDRIIIE